MKLLIAFIFCMSCANAYSFNSGHVCITYLSKDGSLSSVEGNRFSGKDLNSAVDFYIDFRKAVGQIFEDVSVVDYNSSFFARGLSEDMNIYPRKLIQGTDMYFQNGLFFFDRVQDGYVATMDDLSKIIGGRSGWLCMAEADWESKLNDLDD